jgi:aspartate aminotransferase, cytoplasmic
VALNTSSVLEQLQRSEVSNPPAYGAKIAHAILSDATLRSMWYEDLVTMSGRIKTMRQTLYDELLANGMTYSSMCDATK